jgi:arginase
MIKIITVPMDLGAKCLGTADGPQAFIDNQVVQKLEQAGLDVVSTIDVAVLPREQVAIGNPSVAYLDEILRVNNALAANVEQSLRSEPQIVPIVMGGDHSIDLGAYAGAAAVYGDRLGMIYIDAHGDINTEASSLTGNIHGMHLASLLGYGNQQLIDVHYPGVKLPKANLLHIASVDMDQSELELVQSEQLNFISLLDIMSDGLRPVLNAIDQLCAKVDKIWVSLDLDSIDRTYAPAAAMPNPSGLTFREIEAICRYIGAKAQVIGLDVVEYDPSKDIDHKTAELGIELTAKLLGKNYSWYSNYLSQQK